MNKKIIVAIDSSNLNKALKLVKKLKNEALSLGFIHVESGPLVRSSYHAEKHLI